MNYGSLLPADIPRERGARRESVYGRWLRRLAAWMPH